MGRTTSLPALAKGAMHMLRFPCLVLDHDDTVVQSEATVNYPCFCRFLEQYRPGMTITLEEYVAGCSKKPFVEMCRERFGLTDEELHEEYLFWKEYVRNHVPEAFDGIRQLLERYRAAGGLICVSSMSASENILRDYKTRLGLEPDRIFGWDLPEELRKPDPYAIHEICRIYGLEPQQLLLVDDMKFAVAMARTAGCAIAFAGWGRKDFPEICREMETLCDYRFDTPAELEEFLLTEV